MTSVNLVFPHQLFKENPLIENGFPTYLIEEFLFFKQYPFHQQKIAFHRASMKAYASFLASKKIKVTYIESQQDISDIRKLIPHLASKKVETIHLVDPTDNWLTKRIDSTAAKNNVAVTKHPSLLFFNKKEDLEWFFKKEKKKFFQTKFYIHERKKHQILVDDLDNPTGGKWSFDAENRKKYPRKKIAPAITFPVQNKYYKEAVKYVKKHFSKHLGQLSEEPLYPIDFASTEKWLQDFFKNRFHEFGTYEDAIVSQERFLNHSVLTPMLNVGLITPQEIIQKSLAFAKRENVPINSLEGFIRQIIGWREFIRGMYETKGTEERTRNFWGFDRKIPASFYDGTTGIEPIDTTIKKVLQTGYCHHIERLMILGNFMVLCEFSPDEVYQWFMELFIDAYDWVMVPNVYGMSQFADGGLMATKPYISGSNYVLKMSNYKKGDWQLTWDALFWRFMNVNRTFFTKNPRLGMLVGTYDKMSDEKQELLMRTAEEYLEKL